MKSKNTINPYIFNSHVTPFGIHQNESKATNSIKMPIMRRDVQTELVETIEKNESYSLRP